MLPRPHRHLCVVVTGLEKRTSNSVRIDAINRHPFDDSDFSTFDFTRLTRLEVLELNEDRFPISLGVILVQVQHPVASKVIVDLPMNHEQAILAGGCGTLGVSIADLPHFELASRVDDTQDRFTNGWLDQTPIADRGVFALFLEPGVQIRLLIGAFRNMPDAEKFRVIGVRASSFRSAIAARALSAAVPASRSNSSPTHHPPH